MTSTTHMGNEMGGLVFKLGKFPATERQKFSQNSKKTPFLCSHTSESLFYLVLIVYCLRIRKYLRGCSTYMENLALS